jgi:lysozyme family protein
MLQTALVPYGYNIAVDGIWGTGTETALQAYLDQTGA